MAASPLNKKSKSFHARSNSLPSRPHPLILQCNEHLERLRSSNETSSSSSSLLSHKLVTLQDLHECVEKLFQLPLTKESFLHEPQDDLLDGSLRLLDVCQVAKDSLLHTKECTRELQSVIRRRRREEVGITKEAKKFLTSRKVVKKSIFKALANLKAINTKKGNFSSNIKEQQIVALLKDVEVFSLTIFESLLNFIYGSTQVKKGNSWSLVSKLINTKRIGCSQVADESEFSQVDASLQSFMLHMANKSDNFNNLHSMLSIAENPPYVLV